MFYCGRVSHAEQTLENAAGNLRLLEHLIDTLEPGLLQHAHHAGWQGLWRAYRPVPKPRFQMTACRSRISTTSRKTLRARSTMRAGLVSVPPEYAGALFTQQFTQPGFVHWCIRNLVQRTRRRIRLSRSRGLPQHHPGDIVAIVGRRHGMDGNDNSCANQAFNVTNGDVFRWSQLWPVIAAFFDLPCGRSAPCASQTPCPSMRLCGTPW